MIKSGFSASFLVFPLFHAVFEPFTNLAVFWDFGENSERTGENLERTKQDNLPLFAPTKSAVFHLLLTIHDER